MLLGFLSGCSRHPKYLAYLKTIHLWSVAFTGPAEDIVNALWQWVARRCLWLHCWQNIGYIGIIIRHRCHDDVTFYTVYTHFFIEMNVLVIDCHRTHTISILCFDGRWQGSGTVAHNNNHPSVIELLRHCQSCRSHLCRSWQQRYPTGATMENDIPWGSTFTTECRPSYRRSTSFQMPSFWMILDDFDQFD